MIVNLKLRRSSSIKRASMQPRDFQLWYKHGVQNLVKVETSKVLGLICRGECHPITHLDPEHMIGILPGLQIPATRYRHVIVVWEMRPRRLPSVRWSQPPTAWRGFLVYLLRARRGFCRLWRIRVSLTPAAFRGFRLLLALD